MSRKPRNGKPRGRPPGTINKAKAEAIAEAKKGGILPLDYMLNVMRDRRALGTRRDAMAQAAAPYLHPKLANITLQGDRKHPLQVISGKMTAKQAAEAYAETLDSQEDED